MKINEIKLRELWNLGLDDKKISEILCCSGTGVRDKRYKLGLVSKQNRKNKLSKRGMAIARIKDMKDLIKLKEEIIKNLKKEINTLGKRFAIDLK